MEEPHAITPTFTVLMPVYNGAAFLRAAIDSVIGQSRADWELIVVDDGSTDESAAVAAEAAGRDARVRLLRKPNTGISDTLNLGLAAARGEWIARLDCDDEMEPRRLARQLEFLAARPDLGGAASYYTVINRDGHARQQIRPLPLSVDEIEPLFARGGTLRYTHPTVTYRREVAHALGGYRRELEPCEDVDLFVRFFEAGRPVVVQPEFLTRYRAHPGQITASKLHDGFNKVLFIHDNFFRRRAGRPERSYAEFLTSLRTAPLAERVRHFADYGAEILHRRSTALLMADRTFAGYLCLAGAGALRPVRAARRLLRR
ncbi:MAG TPA: glycosyltransferase [Burkholderiaceae bacterium]|nr:glycosyltransferase [Burkholderiaceae bacterium]